MINPLDPLEITPGSVFIAEKVLPDPYSEFIINNIVFLKTHDTTVNETIHIYDNWTKYSISY